MRSLEELEDLGYAAVIGKDGKVEAFQVNAHCGEALLVATRQKCLLTYEAEVARCKAQFSKLTTVELGRRYLELGDSLDEFYKKTLPEVNCGPDFSVVRSMETNSFAYTVLSQADVDGYQSAYTEFTKLLAKGKALEIGFKENGLESDPQIKKIEDRFVEIRQRLDHAALWIGGD